MKILKLITLSLFVSLTFFSCDSDDDSSSNQPTTQELLAHKWFMVIEGANACEATSYMEFELSGRYTTESFYINSGTGDCSSGGFLDRTYELLDDNVTIRIFLNSSTIEFVIKEISTTDLLLGALDDDGVEEGEVLLIR